MDNWTEIGTTTADITTYTDDTAVAGTTYTYRVKAENNAERSAFVESNHDIDPTDSSDGGGWNGGEQMPLRLRGN